MIPTLRIAAAAATLAAGMLAPATPVAAQRPASAPAAAPPVGIPVGAPAPDFALRGATRYGQLQAPVRLSDYRGQTVVLAFFYQARTKG